MRIFNTEGIAGGTATDMDGINPLDVFGDGSNVKLEDGDWCFVGDPTAKTSAVYVASYKAGRIVAPGALEAVPPVANGTGWAWVRKSYTDNQTSVPSGTQVIINENDAPPAGYNFIRNVGYSVDLGVSPLNPWYYLYFGCKEGGANYIYRWQQNNGWIARLNSSYQITTSSYLAPPANYPKFKTQHVFNPLDVTDPKWIFQGTNSSGTLWICDVVAKTWTEILLTTGFPGSARKQMVVAYDGTYIYVLNGSNEGESAWYQEFHRYNVATPGWEVLSVDTGNQALWDYTTRCRMWPDSNGDLWVIDASWQSYNIFKYTEATNTWSIPTSLPAGLQSSAIDATGAMIYLKNMHSLLFLNGLETWIYDISGDTWSTVHAVFAGGDAFFCKLDDVVHAHGLYADPTGISDGMLKLYNNL